MHRSTGDLILGDGGQYVQDIICVVGLVERRCLSDDAVALPETERAPENRNICTEM